MKVLYVAYRHDPRNPDLASGSDYQFYKAIKDNGFDIDLLGPLAGPPVVIEHWIRQIYKLVTRKRYAKFTLSRSWYASQALNQYVQKSHPDIVFSMFPAPLVFYTGQIPYVYRLDTTFLGQEQDWPLYGKLALLLSIWEEKRVFDNCAQIITHSNWSKQVIMEQYKVQGDLIEVFPNPASLPPGVTPQSSDHQVKKIQPPP